MKDGGQTPRRRQRCDPADVPSAKERAPSKGTLTKTGMNLHSQAECPKLNP
ncbi:hypothetical protein H1P_390017 [Hyella patelloides LEGE 07179]|uniref:Uncharacterized protein n=1 Tax=Hyella patelloides LEGE 07179 TaxID=945734 RepID=A0A563VWX8_9CYAN|nr:hypothetical protein [Hyella patelloides]VEP15949.1 hypothetical protein H1P_390017 [Hyella patelloides LEGE 07179]